MNLTICAKICRECPFSKNAIRGYLDYHTPEEILDAMNRDLPFSCHMQRGDDPEKNMKELLAGKQKVCRGFVAAASKSCKRFGQHPYYGKEMRKLQELITDQDKEEVLTKWQWTEYHKIPNL